MTIGVFISLGFLSIVLVCVLIGRWRARYARRHDSSLLGHLRRTTGSVTVETMALWLATLCCIAAIGILLFRPFARLGLW